MLAFVYVLRASGIFYRVFYHIAAARFAAKVFGTSSALLPPLVFVRHCLHEAQTGLGTKRNYPSQSASARFRLPQNSRYV